MPGAKAGHFLEAGHVEFTSLSRQQTNIQTRHASEVLMYKMILVPIDFAHEERVAAMIAAAKKLGGKNCLITLLTVIEDIPLHLSAELPPTHMDDIKYHALKRLEALARKFRCTADIKVTRGHAARGILKFAENTGADVIVIASHKPGWQDYLIGSTASRIVNHAKCSIHVIR